MFTPWKKSYDQPRQHIKKQKHYFADKGLSSLSYGFFSNQSWTITKLSTEELMLLNCGVGEDSWESLDCKESNQSILKEINPEYSLRRLMMKLKLQYFGHLMRRTDSLEKDPDAGKDWRQEEKGMTEDGMVGQHHRLNGHDFEQAPGDDEGQGRLACCSSWGCKIGTWLRKWTTTPQITAEVRVLALK